MLMLCILHQREAIIMIINKYLSAQVDENITNAHAVNRRTVPERQ